MTPEIQQVQDLSEQEQIRRAKLAKYQEEGRDPYTITRFDRTHTSAQILADFDALEGKTVRIAGRMMSRRIMGKASFVHMLDGDGQIQAYVRREDAGRKPGKPGNVADRPYQPIYRAALPGGPDPDHAGGRGALQPRLSIPLL